jgi:DNA-3-methyladenine glycosylase
LDKSWLEQDPVKVAERLIGCCLIRETDAGAIIVQITETEAYRGSDDPASHAFRTRTPRNQLMFGDVGRLYVYFIYGMHFCMNVVAHQPGEVGAVLLRAAKPLEGIELIRLNRPGVPDRSLLDGPGKLAKGLGVDKSDNGYDIIGNPDNRLSLQLTDPPHKRIQATPRIGITKGTELLWRFKLDD